MRAPPEYLRCRYTTQTGRRCRYERLPGHESGLCGYHFNSSSNFKHKPLAALIAPEILGPDDGLDSAASVIQLLTRLIRLLAQNRLSARDATAMGYLGQLVINTLPHLQREAAAGQTSSGIDSATRSSFKALFDTLEKLSQPPAAGSSAPPGPEEEPRENTMASGTQSFVHCAEIGGHGECGPGGSPADRVQLPSAAAGKPKGSG
jgi:plasmid stabilization system protein ParE